MSDKKDEKSVEETLRATDTLLGIVPHVASLALGFTALAYLVGWLEASAYYGDLGAAFALPLLTASQILKTGAWLISLVAIFTLVSIYLLTQGEIGQKGLRRWALFHMIAAALCYGIATLFHAWLETSTTILLSAAASVFWALALAATLGEVIACLQGTYKWGRYEIFILYVAVTFGFFYAPRVMGNVRADAAANQPSSLKAVLLEDADSVSDWRLAGIVGDYVLLMIPATGKTDRKFRFVHPEEMQTISSPAAVRAPSSAPKDDSK